MAHLAPDLRSRFLGAMLGSAIGDAAGERAFFVYQGEKSGRPERLVGELDRLAKLGYTDDTAMSLVVAETLAQDHGVDPERLGARLAEEHAREPWRGYASGPPLVFARVASGGVGYVEAALALVGGEGSLGNGAAMRASPVGLFFHDSPDLREQAVRSAQVTHTHPQGIDGAVILARATALACSLAPGEPVDRRAFLAELAKAAGTSALREKLSATGALLERGAPRAEVADRLGRGVRADRSVPYAVYCFLRKPDSFERCLFAAVLEDGDRDTVGAMACALAGARLGEGALPASWREKLENLGRIERAAERLFEARAARLTRSEPP